MNYLANKHGKQMVSVEITIRSGVRHCDETGKVSWAEDMRERKHLVTASEIHDDEIIRAVHDILFRLREAE